jgi:hypothetical protein
MQEIIIQSLLGNAHLPSRRLQCMYFLFIRVSCLIQPPPKPNLINNLLYGALFNPFLVLPDPRLLNVHLLPPGLGRPAMPPQPEMNDLFLEMLVLDEAVMLERVVSDESEHLFVVVPVEDLGVVDGEPWVIELRTVAGDVLHGPREVYLAGARHVLQVHFQHLLPR